MNRHHRVQISRKPQQQFQWELEFDSVNKSINSEPNNLRYEINSDMIEDDQTQFNQFIKTKKQKQLNEGQRQFRLVNENISSKKSKLSIQKAQKVHQKLVVMVMVSYLMEKRRENRIKQWTNNPMKGNLNKKKQYEQYFSHSLQQSLQTLKWNRIQNIPKQKRTYYLGKDDIISIQLKNHLKNMINQQIKQFDIKQNISQLFDTQKYKSYIKIIQNYVMTKNQTINYDKFQQTIRKINMKQIKQNKKLMVQNSLLKNLQIIKYLHKASKQKINTYFKDQYLINRINHLNYINNNKKVIPNSQNCIQFISVKNIFRIISGLKKLKPLDQKTDQNQILNNKDKVLRDFQKDSFDIQSNIIQ